MREEITIGLLLPASSIVPMSKEFEIGLKNGLKDQQVFDIEIVKEYIGNGDSKKTEDACVKLLTYDRAELVTGIINGRLLQVLAPKFESKESVLLANSLGEMWYDPANLNKNIFTNSLHAWEQVWALGKYGVEKFGLYGMFVSSTFDSGFAFFQALNDGMLRAKGEKSSISYAIAPAPEALEGKLAEVEKVIPFIEEKNPDFIFAAFCGEEASIFLDLYEQAGLEKKIPLLSLPYLIEPCKRSFSDPITIHSSRFAAGSDSSLMNPLNWRNDFRQLGLETGLMISEALKKGADDLSDFLSKETLETDRGEIGFNPVPVPNQNPLVHLNKVLFSGDPKSSTVTFEDSIQSVTIADEKIVNLTAEKSSGWYNPYLSV